MQFALKYSGTKFLSTENQNYPMSLWILSEVLLSKKIQHIQEMSTKDDSLFSLVVFYKLESFK